MTALNDAQLQNIADDIKRELLPRDFYTEAQMILKGLPMATTRQHLEALEEHYQCSLIRVANKLGELKATILEMP